MKRFFIEYKNKIRKIIDDRSYNDFLNKSKKYTYKIREKIKIKLKNLGLDECIYKAHKGRD